MTDQTQQAQHHTKESAELAWLVAKLLLTIDCAQAKEGDKILDEVVCEVLLKDDRYKALWGAEC